MPNPLADTIYDLLIIGGGINGAAIARDASGRGLSVCLVEQGDLASGTSSASSKLIHGGLRYLEQYQFGMVRKALREREIALKQAPHLTHPLAFILPHQPKLRPQWMIQIGLWLYDHLAKRDTLPASRRVLLQNTVYGGPLKSSYQVGFEYYDCFTDDARLVVSLALDAHRRGARILTYHQVITLQRQYKRWQAEVKNQFNGETQFIHARAVVNATGPWSNLFFQTTGLPIPHEVVLVKGSHIVVPRLYEGDHAYTLQNTDGRIIFVIPYQQWTLVGTTDIPYIGNPKDVRIEQQEIDYLCLAVQQHFKQAIDPKAIIWSYAGVRPLVKAKASSISALSRDYTLMVQTERGLPLLSVLGGKITTHRELAEAALEKLSDFFPCLSCPWTAQAPLPGGDLPQTSFEAFVKATQLNYPWLPAKLCERYARQYGTRIRKVLGAANKLDDLGICFGADLYEREVAYLIEEEWAHTVTDILFRRTKLGLSLDNTAVTILQAWLDGKKTAL